MNNNSSPANSNQNGANRNGKGPKGTDQNKKTNRGDKRFWMVIVVFVVLAVLVIWDSHREPGVTTQTDTASDSDSLATTTNIETVVADVSATSSAVYNYSCDDGKNIMATFHLPKDDFVNIRLGDGRAMILAHTVSADGARYGNANESFVFWTKGDSAFVQEHATTTYSGCIANRFP